MQPDDDKTKSHFVPTKGTMVSHYRIIEKIGAGGMGEVYLAEDTKLGRDVILKFMTTSGEFGRKLADRFNDEIKSLAMAAHPNIVTIYEANEYMGSPYFVMEYFHGRPLKDLIYNKELSITDSIDIGIKICKGLEKAHKAGLVHADINPNNILVNNEHEIKILDFGLAHLFESPGTGGGEVLSGTITYLSPEQINGNKLDNRSDIFSLGTVLYEMLAGELPFKGDYEAATMYSIVNVSPRPVRDIVESIPDKLQDVLDRALSKDSEHRYNNVHKMAVDLEMILDDADGTASKSSHIPSSIAVLNFSDLSARHNQQFFCDGMADEIINALTKIRGLRVTPRSSAIQVSKRENDPRRIGKLLGVDSVLEGSVRKAENRLRIIVQLIDVKDGCYIWSEKYDRDMSDVFAVQDEIAMAISEKLRTRDEGPLSHPLIRKYTENIEAYNEYLKGRYYWNRRYEGGLQRAIQHFQKAIEYDPLYALAYAGLADSFNIMGFYNFMPPHEACARAKAASIRALEIDPDLAEAHTSLGWVESFYDWNWDEAECEFKKAIDLNPKYSIVHHYYGLFLLSMKRFGESRAKLNKALEIDPLATIIGSSLAAAYYFERRHEESIQHHLKALNFDPDFAIGHAFFAGPYVCLSQYDKAADECLKAQSLSGGSIYPTAFLAYVYGMAGKKEDARNLLNQLLERSNKEYISSYHIALIYSGLGEIDHALEWLEKAYDERDNWMVWLNIYPVFDNLRNDSRFISIVKKVGLPDESEV